MRWDEMADNLLHKPLQEEELEDTDYSSLQQLVTEEERLTEKETLADLNNFIKTAANF